MSEDPTFNLSALADRLFSENRLLPLAGKIRRTRDLHSLCTDLVMALESLDALDELTSQPTDLNDHRKMITESALLGNAIILYTRATKTTSKERAGFDITSRLDSSQKEVHREICDLRDAAIAHFGSGGTYSGEWQGELAILQMQGEDAKPGVITRRQTIDKNLALRVRGQAELALGILKGVFMQLTGDLTDAINDAAKDDPEFYKEIQRHPLNLELFLKSPVAAKAARASFDSGYTKGAVEHS